MTRCHVKNIIYVSNTIAVHRVTRQNVDQCFLCWHLAKYKNCYRYYYTYLSKDWTVGRRVLVRKRTRLKEASRTNRGVYFAYCLIYRTSLRNSLCMPQCTHCVHTLTHTRVYSQLLTTNTSLNLGNSRMCVCMYYVCIGQGIYTHTYTNTLVVISFTYPLAIIYWTYICVLSTRFTDCHDGRSTFVRIEWYFLYLCVQIVYITLYALLFL